MSEHSRGFTAEKWREYVAAAAQASDGRVLIVPGIEYGDADDVVHIPVWGNAPFFGDAPPTGQLLRQAFEVGATAVWAHPWRRDAWRRFDPSWIDHLAAVEVWNRKYDGIAPSREALNLARREGMPSFVALDFHTRRQVFPLSLTLQLDRPATPQAVYAALQKGQFSPRAFGVQVDRLTRGPGGLALHGLERMRRSAAKVLR